MSRALLPLLFLMLGCHASKHVPSGPSEVPVDPVPVAASVDRARVAVDAPDRSEEDRALDAGRHPAELLGFLDLPEGSHVAEIGAGGGYTSELLARYLGPEAVVWGQNAPFVLERFAEAPWSARLAKPVMANVRRLDRPFDDPFPADFEDAGRLSAVVNVLFYHDTVWQGVDRAAMNRDVFEALAPGGLYVIVDHAARPEDGATVTESLHRIAEDFVVEEITSAGFVLDRTADFLRSPEDTMDWSASPRVAGERRGTSDRFVLVFRRP